MTGVGRVEPELPAQWGRTQGGRAMGKTIVVLAEGPIGEKDE